MYTMEYYSAIKRNKTRPFLDMDGPRDCHTEWEVSQKEKNKYRILTHICGIQKNGTGEPVCKAEIETQIQRKNVCTPRGGNGWCVVV